MAELAGKATNRRPHGMGIAAKRVRPYTRASTPATARRRVVHGRYTPWLCYILEQTAGEGTTTPVDALPWRSFPHSHGTIPGVAGPICRRETRCVETSYQPWRSPEGVIQLPASLSKTGRSSPAVAPLASLCSAQQLPRPDSFGVLARFSSGGVTAGALRAAAAMLAEKRMVGAERAPRGNATAAAKVTSTRWEPLCPLSLLAVIRLSSSQRRLCVPKHAVISDTIPHGVAAAATAAITGGIAGAEHPSLRDETVPVEDTPGAQASPVLFLLQAHRFTGILSRRTRGPHGIRGNEDTEQGAADTTAVDTGGTVAEGEQVSHGDETVPT